MYLLLVYFIQITLINPAYTTYEIRRQLDSSEATAIFTLPSKYAAVVKSIADNRMVKLPIIVIDDGNNQIPDGSINFRDMVRDDIDEFAKSGQEIGINPEDTFMLPYSSGTSGLPKGVELSHRYIIFMI